MERTSAELLRRMNKDIEALKARRDTRTGRVGSPRAFYPTGTRYIRVAVIDGTSALSGAHVIADYYGGASYGGSARNSGRIHFSQRGSGSGSAALSVWNFGATTVNWYLRYVSGFQFELWVMLPSFASTISIRPGDVMNGRMTFDSETTVAPSGLVAASTQDVMADGGWVDLSSYLASGYTLTGGAGFRGRILNGEVTLQTTGNILGSFAERSTSTIIGTLPALWRPTGNAWGSCYVIFASDGPAPGSALMRPAGTFSVLHERVGSGTGTGAQFMIKYPLG